MGLLLQEFKTHYAHLLINHKNIPLRKAFSSVFQNHIELEPCRVQDFPYGSP